MIDREYVKLNTSINTGSNSGTLHRDEEGNIEATIELQLPDNLFDSNAHTRKIEKVDMQTSKMRLSLENTPIAEMPLDTKVTTESTKATPCKLDVYPYCLLDDNAIKPNPVSETSLTPFPNYKNHKVTLNIFLQQDYLVDPIQIDTITITANSDADGFPTTSRYYDVFSQTDLLTGIDHMMNMCAQSNHEPYQIDGDDLMIVNIGTLEQMLQDALESAITYALTQSTSAVSVFLVNRSVADLHTDVQARRDLPTIYLEEYSTNAYYQKWQPTEREATCSLNYACKPSVKISEQSISISYDTAAFDQCIPIIWNTPYVETWDTPEQLTLDTLRKNVWALPPPKRAYKYGASIAENDPKTYDFTVLSDLTCAAMNIIANKAMRDTFSYLPWIKVNTTSISEFRSTTPMFEVSNAKRTVRTTTSVTQPLASYILFPKGVDYTTQFRVIGLRLDGGDATAYGGSATSWMYYFSIKKADIQDEFSNTTEWYNRYPASKRYGQRTNIGSNHYVGGYAVWTSYDDSLEYDGEEYGCIPSNLNITSVVDTTLPDVPIDSYTSNDSTLTAGTTVSASTGSSMPSPIVYKNEYAVQSCPCSHYTVNEPSASFNWGYPPEGQWNDSLDVLNQWQRWNPIAWDVAVYPTLVSETSDSATYVVAWTLPNYSAHVGVPRADDSAGQHIAGTKLVFATNYRDTYARATTVTEVMDTAPTVISVQPNFSTKDESGNFYILDGTSAEISIGPQELILGGDTYRIGTRITEVTTTEDQQRTVTLVSAGGAIDPETFLPIRDANLNHYRTNWSISAVYDPDASPLVIEFIQSSGGLVWIAEEIIAPASSHESASAWETVDTAENTTTEVVDDPSLPIGTTTEHIEDAPSSGPLTGEIRDLSSVAFYINETEDQGGNLNVLVPSSDDLDALNLVAGATCVWKSESPYKYYPAHEPYLITTTPVGPGHEVRMDVVWELTPSEDWDSPTQGNFTRTERASAEATRDETRQVQTIVTTSEAVDGQATPDVGNLRLTYTWSNLPMVVMSPIQSIVLTLQGVRVAQEYQPINRTEVGGSTLTSSIPVIENFYSLAQTLRDLHDELVVVKESFDDTATYGLDTKGGMQRSLTLSAKYITKDGRLHQIYIPPNGVFSLQLTFGISFFST